MTSFRLTALFVVACKLYDCDNKNIDFTLYCSYHWVTSNWYPLGNFPAGEGTISIGTCC